MLQLVCCNRYGRRLNNRLTHKNLPIYCLRKISSRRLFRTAIGLRTACSLSACPVILATRDGSNPTLIRLSRAMTALSPVARHCGLFARTMGGLATWASSATRFVTTSAAQNVALISASKSGVGLLEWSNRVFSLES